MTTNADQYSYVWEYTVTAGHEAEFETAYGPEGTWVQLFRRAPGYLHTELLRDRRQPNRYLTVDLWESAGAWAAFRESFAAEFDAIDARCEAWTEQEREVGVFDRFVR